MGKGTPDMLTEVNVNLNTLLKFHGVSNVLVELRPSSRLAGAPSEQAASSPSPAPSQPAPKPNWAQLDTSFDTHLTLGNALEQLEQPKQTPALGEFSCPNSAPS